MVRLFNTLKASPLALPGGVATIPMHKDVGVSDAEWERLKDHPVVKRWLSGGTLQVLDVEPEVTKETPAKRPRKQPSSSVLEILDLSVKEVVRFLPNLTDAELNAVIQAEKDGKARVTLQRAFDDEWSRRRGADS